MFCLDIRGECGAFDSEVFLLRGGEGVDLDLYSVCFLIVAALSAAVTAGIVFRVFLYVSGISGGALQGLFC